MNDSQSVKVIFEHAYEGFCNSFQGIIEFIVMLGKCFIVCLIYLTIPIWILPYAIFKKREVQGDDE